MSDIIKTITASFETIDLAELACKHIKQQYQNINAISIRYKNIPYDRQNYHSVTDEDIPPNPVIAGTTALGGASAPLNSGVNTTITPLGTVFAGQNISEDGSLIDNNTPEIEQSLESKVIVKTSNNDADTISHTLRGLGGQNISVK